jgi:hypothetical protein
VNDYSNLQKITQENALNLARFFIKSEKNFLLFGKSGTGKTELILQAIKECNFKVNYINLSVMERCDLGGYPDINSSSNSLTFKYPYFLPRLPEGSKPDTVWLFDEVDKCSPETTAPLLEILQFRKINGVPLNIAACMLTSNLMTENSYSNRISSALTDRTAKYILEFDFNLWIDWAKSNNVHDLILGFLRSNHEFACASAEETAYASPSPRSWTWASQALLRAKDLKMIDIGSITQIISGYVGNEAGMRFEMWYSHYRTFEPHVNSLIERGQMSFNFEELVPTEKIVFVVAACYHAKLKVFGDKSKNRFVYLERLCKFFNDYKVDAEMQVMGLHNSFSFENIRQKKLYECKSFFDHFTKLTENVSFKK